VCGRTAGLGCRPRGRRASDECTASNRLRIGSREGIREAAPPRPRAAGWAEARPERKAIDGCGGLHGARLQLAAIGTTSAARSCGCQAVRGAAPPGSCAAGRRRRSRSSIRVGFVQPECAASFASAAAVLDRRMWNPVARPAARALRDGGGEGGAGGAFGRQKIRGAIMEAIGRM
jgi:hypothetical protein